MLSSGMYHRVIWLKFTCICEEPTGSSTLKMEAVNFSETMVNLYQAASCHHKNNNLPERFSVY